jgi:hypothetical protein
MFNRIRNPSTIEEMLLWDKGRCVQILESHLKAAKGATEAL